MIRFPSFSASPYWLAVLTAAGAMAAGTAWAQVATPNTALPPTPAPYAAAPGAPPASKVDPLAPDPGVATGPIEGGKHLQPRGKPTEAGKADADALLQAGSHSAAAKSPPVIPRDLYGQPMDGAPDPTQVK